eukprot:Opistho-2@11048
MLAKHALPNMNILYKNANKSVPINAVLHVAHGNSAAFNDGEACTIEVETERTKVDTEAKQDERFFAGTPTNAMAWLSSPCGKWGPKCRSLSLVRIIRILGSSHLATDFASELTNLRLQRNKFLGLFVKVARNFAL